LTEAERQLKVVTKNLSLLRERYNKLVEEAQGLRDQLAQASGAGAANTAGPKPGDSTFVKELTEAATSAHNSSRFSDFTLLVTVAPPAEPSPLPAAVATPTSPTGEAAPAAEGCGDSEENGEATATAAAAPASPERSATPAATVLRLPAHRWLLRARSKFFQSLPLEELDHYAFDPSVTPELAQTLLKYLYTDQVDLTSMSDKFALRVLALSDVGARGG